MDETVTQERTTTEQCVRCLEPVPLNAPRCPHCGEPVSHRRRTVFKVIAIAGIVAMAFMLVVMYRTVYISDSQATAVDEEEAARRDPFAEQASSAEQGGAKADEKPPSPPEPEKPPPLNR